MSWVLTCVIVVMIGLTILAARGCFSHAPAPVDDRPGLDLPDGPITGRDLRDVKIAVVTRGYSMEQVDAILDRLAQQLDGPLQDEE